MEHISNDISKLTVTQLNSLIEHFFRQKKVMKEVGNTNISPDWIFQSKISEYKFRKTRNEDFGITHDFRGDPNKGWKIHLNVGIENIARVSQYLKDNHFYHKFLSGGNIEDGKTFTVYIGSYSLVQIVANRLSLELANNLLPPRADTDIRLANNISGRFEFQGEGSWSGYGISGFSIHDLPLTLWGSSKDEIKNAEVKSFQYLLNHFGAYFFDLESQINNTNRIIYLQSCPIAISKILSK